ncbi:unnamed protein product [Litomosoides sigmodontis]|uniref:ZP domain-containing protein n=1 Tax=Litomosoides sigmodontis TaxID=42156 RepID=A0A3P6V688_LITSI|nr:unnamed protein product [Litomosoides sigmodontis]
MRGGTVDDSNVSENMLQGITSEEELINSKNVKNDVNTYPYPSPQYTTTTNYEPQLSAKELGPAPPSVMPVIDYSEEQKQITDTTGYNSAIPVHCANIAAPLETNYATNVGFTYPTTPEFTTIDTDTTTTTTATTTTLLCVTQISNNYKQAVGINKTPTIPTTTTTTNFAISEASMEEGRNSAIEFMPDGYETTKIAEDVQLTHQRTPTPTPQATVASNIEMATTSKSKFEQLENFPTDYSQPSQMLTAHPTQLPSNVTATTAVTSRVTATSTGIVRNRLRGKARLTCKQDGLQFEINTLFPFTGQIFAHDRKHAAECYFTFDKATLINVTMSYATCGMRNSEEQRPETQYHMKIIVVFQQRDNTSTMQSFLTQCMHQKIQYQKQVIPKRIEEALEELRLIPTKLEHKAQVPECMMRIVAEEEHGHGDDGTETEVVNIGQPMRIEWSLVPESDAYGFHVRNCTVRDTFSNEEYMVIDQQGCSTDINIFTHPHYDTYHDIARVHWHAFKVPDINQLTIKCSIEICTDIPDTVSGLTSCDSIPSPPFCPDLITSATNALLSDPELKVIRKRRENKLFQQYVHADICFGDKTDEYCSSETYRTDYERHIKTFNNNSSKQYCLSRLWLGISTGLSALTVLLAITVHGYCRYLRRQRYGPIKLAANFTPPPPSSQQQ